MTARRHSDPGDPVAIAAHERAVAIDSAIDAAIEADLRGPDPRELIGRYVAELLNGAQPAAAAVTLLTPGFVFIGPGNRDGIRSPAAFAEFQAGMRAAFSDLVFTLDDAIIEGARAALVLRMGGRHTGPFLGVEPSGRAFELPLVDILEFRVGRIAAITAYLDALDLRRQLEAQ